MQYIKKIRALFNFVDVRTVEHGGGLEEHADLAAQGEDVDGADVGAVEEHGAGRGLPEAVERAEQRGLAAAAGPDDAHDDPARHVQVDAPEDLLAGGGVGGLGAAPQPAHPYLGLRRRRRRAAVHVQQVLPEIICPCRRIMSCTDRTCR